MVKSVNYTTNGSNSQSLSLDQVKKLTLYFLSKRDLNLSQILRVMRKYDPDLTNGLLEQAVLELLILDKIEELSADHFCLMDPIN